MLPRLENGYCSWNIICDSNIVEKFISYNSNYVYPIIFHFQLFIYHHWGDVKFSVAPAAWW